MREVVFRLDTITPREEEEDDEDDDEGSSFLLFGRDHEGRSVALQWNPSLCLPVIMSGTVDRLREELPKYVEIPHYTVETKKNGLGAFMGDVRVVTFMFNSRRKLYMFRHWLMRPKDGATNRRPAGPHRLKGGLVVEVIEQFNPLWAQAIERAGVRPGSLVRATTTAAVTRLTHCDVEARVLTLEPCLSSIPPPPVRVLSFDIETEVPVDGKLATPENSRVFMISSTCYSDINNDSLEPVTHTHYFHPGLPPPKEEEEVKEEEGQLQRSEEEVLRGFAALLKDFGPDVVTGYHIINFDLPFLIARAKKYNIKLNLSWFTHSSAKMHERVVQGRQSYVIENTGRMLVDMYQYYFNKKGRSSYKLDSVAQSELGEGKSGLSIEAMARVINQPMYNIIVAAQELEIVVQYCEKDAELPGRLMRHRSVMPELIAMASVVGVPVNLLLTHGQDLRVRVQLLRKAHEMGFVLPNLPKGDCSKVGYQGALVIDPKNVGLFQFTATLDFASLYPSIIRLLNISYETLVRLKQLTPEQHAWVRSVDGVMFSQEAPGVLPALLTSLLDARKRVRAEMKALDPTSAEWKILNAQQLAYKVACNSVYGFMGNQSGSYTVTRMAAAVTLVGRELLKTAGNFVEIRKCRVLYGDTDSLMVWNALWKTAEEARAGGIWLGAEFSRLVHEAFTRPNCVPEWFTPLLKKMAAPTPDSVLYKEPPIDFEFEEVFVCFMLLCKKMYCAKLLSGEFMEKGLPTARTDTPPFIKRVLGALFRAVVQDGDLEQAKQGVLSAYTMLRDNALPVTDYVVSKSLGKATSKTKKINAQQVVAHRTKQRGQKAVPKQGDKVAYVIVTIESQKKCRQKNPEDYYEVGPERLRAWRAEDPECVEPLRLLVDRDFYLESLHRMCETVAELAGFYPAVKAAFEDTQRHIQNERRRCKPISGFFCSKRKAPEEEEEEEEEGEEEEKNKKKMKHAKAIFAGKLNKSVKQQSLKKPRKSIASFFKKPE